MRANIRRFAIVGCGGFVGSHLVDRLLTDGHNRIEGFDPDDRKIRRHLSSPRLRLHRCSVDDRSGFEKLRRAIDRADVVVNLAAICNPSQYNTRPLETIRANFLDLHRIVDYCSARGKWLVHFSTSEVYGRTVASYLPDRGYDDAPLYELDEDDTPLIMGPVRNQRWTYACAKQLIERYIYAHHRERGLPFTIVRPLNFFGPRMDFIPGRDGEGVPRVLACFMTALLDGTPLRLVDGGTARRTIVSIHDAVEAIHLVLQHPAKSIGHIFNVGNRDNEVTIAELADRMRRTYAKITGDPSYRTHPMTSVSSDSFYGEGYEDCDRRMPRLEKMYERLGWTPHRSLDEILLETMTYYHRRYGRSGTGTSRDFAPRRRIGGAAG